MGAVGFLVPALVRIEESGTARLTELPVEVTRAV
jgi:hypothetical protein